MATTTYGVNHALAVKAWSRRLFHEVIGEQYFSKFIGEDSNSMVQMQTETNKAAGDRVRVGLRMLLTGAGIAGDNTLEGNEEALTTYSDDVFVDQLRHSTRSNGKMTEQRVHFSLREENRAALRDWWQERLQVWMANQLSCNTAQTDTRYTGMQAPVTVDANHLVIAGATGATAETSISATTVPGTGQYFTLRDIDVCVARAKTQTPRIRPIRYNGRDVYIMFVHPYAVYALRNDTSATNSWVTLQQATIQGGKDIMDSPIGSGALGYYNQTLLHEWAYLPNAVSSSAVSVGLIRRNIFCGAQAGILAHGQDNGPNQMSWVEELFDYGNQLGVAAGLISGMKATQFNAQLFGTIVVSSYAPTV